LGACKTGVPSSKLIILRDEATRIFWRTKYFEYFEFKGKSSMLVEGIYYQINVLRAEPRSGSS
jgi:hypothetical protein